MSKSKRVFIAGADGFVGSILAPTAALATLPVYRTIERQQIQ